MTESPDTQDPRAAENGRFFEKIERALRDLFERARARNELHFAFSLNPEFRGEQGPGWSTADDAHMAFGSGSATVDFRERCRGQSFSPALIAESTFFACSERW